MEIWKCPVCGKQLLKEDRCYKCSESHQFDIAKQGYINLLQSQVSKSKQHGDEKEMVRARQEFLEKGYYGIFRETLGNLLNLDEAVLKEAQNVKPEYKNFIDKLLIQKPQVKEIVIPRPVAEGKDRPKPVEQPKKAVFEF